MTAVKKIILSSLSKICLCPYGQYGANDLDLQIEKGSSVWNSTVLFSLASELQGAALTIKAHQGASLVAQWLRICLPMQGGHGFKPWSGKIPHAAEQLGPWATITEPACLEPVLCNKRGRDNERPALAATRESPRTETKTQHSHK